MTRTAMPGVCCSDARASFSARGRTTNLHRPSGRILGSQESPNPVPGVPPRLELVVSSPRFVSSRGCNDCLRGEVFDVSCFMLCVIRGQYLDVYHGKFRI